MTGRLTEGLVVVAGLCYLVLLGVAIGSMPYDVWGLLVVIPPLGLLGALVIRTMFSGELVAVRNILYAGLIAKLIGTALRYWVGFEAYAGGIDAQTALSLDRTLSGTAAGGVPAEFTFEPTESGFLTVILRGTTEGGDLVLSVTDEEYQELADGRSDQDYGQDVGAEQVMLPIPSGGRYRVLVASPYGDQAVSFEIGGSFLRTALASAPPDPDGRPSRANTRIEISTTIMRNAVPQRS